MDHMMPEMDGIETTKRLREMGYSGTIVALTANAVSGQSAIFLGNGFNDFISKPIDVRHLNTILNKHIRDKQPKEIIEATRKQAGIEKPISKDKKTEQSEIDPEFAKIFVRDADRSLIVLEEIMAKGVPISHDDLRTYVIHTHGMKSALANIGKMDLSAVALKLEERGREEELEVIATDTPEFLANLRAFVETIRPAEPDEETVDAADEDTSFLHEKLQAIKSACEEFDESAGEDALAALGEKPWTRQTKTWIDKISEHLLHSDFDEIIEMIDGIDKT